MKRIALSVALAACTFSSVAVLASRPAEDAGNGIQEALDRAIDDERHAIAFYTAVMAKHGERRPFSNIINAERRHEAALLAQYKRLGLEVPVDRWAKHAFQVQDSFAELCDASAVAEVRNGQIYDELIAECEDPIVREVFERLRWASVERHLRAFRRHGSGWEEVEAKSLDEHQKAQRDAALAAREALFGSLFAELLTAMEEGGPTAAIDVCATRAPAIAADVAAERGVRIGRTSFKLRNPTNTPPVWADLALDDRPDEPMYFADRSGRLGSLTPIRLAASCLQCHGANDDIAPATRVALARRYPDDQATGFSEGDLRGWFWIEAPPRGPEGEGTD
jgi:rubrerythrin